MSSECDEQYETQDTFCSRVWKRVRQCPQACQHLGRLVCGCLLCLPCCDCLFNMCYKYDCANCCGVKGQKHDIEIEIQSRPVSLDDNINGEPDLNNSCEDTNKDLNPNITWTIEDCSEQAETTAEYRRQDDMFEHENEMPSPSSMEQNLRPSRTKSMPTSKSLTDIKRNNFKSMTISSKPKHSLSVGRLETSPSLTSLENIFVTGYRQTAV